MFFMAISVAAYAQKNVLVGGSTGRCPTLAYQYAGGAGHYLICDETSFGRGGYISTDGGNTWTGETVCSLEAKTAIA